MFGEEDGCHRQRQIEHILIRDTLATGVGK